LAPTVGITATGFCYPGGILHLFCRQDQQILWLSIAAAISFQQIQKGSIIVIIWKIFIDNSIIASADPSSAMRRQLNLQRRPTHPVGWSSSATATSS
jgi:hypothetical protein